MPTPLVSILIPTYRRPDLLAVALASAVGQTYRNLQIVVRDNGSGDQTPEVVRSFNDPRIDFLQAPKNEGAWRNSLECVRHAKGKYLIPLCDDDILGDSYVETLTGFMEADPEIIAAYGATHSIDKDGKVTGKKEPDGSHKWDATEIIRAWCEGRLPLISGINFLCRTSFYLSLGERHCFPDGHNSDNAIYVTGGIRGKVLFTDQCVFYYRLHSLNSVQRHSCKLRATGDRAFLSFLDTEVKADTNASLPVGAWPRLRQDLQGALSTAYYAHLFALRMHGDSMFSLLKNLLVHPAETYGVRLTLRNLRQNRTVVSNELRRRCGFAAAADRQGAGL